MSVMQPHLLFRCLHVVHAPVEFINLSSNRNVSVSAVESSSKHGNKEREGEEGEDILYRHILFNVGQRRISVWEQQTHRAQNYMHTHYHFSTGVGG